MHPDKVLGMILEEEDKYISTGLDIPHSIYTFSNWEGDKYIKERSNRCNL